MKRKCESLRILSEEQRLCEATFLRRPSIHNKSPYVGDILVNGVTKIVHMPAMDMGGKCREGVKCLVSVIHDKAGNEYEDGSVGGQYKKPRCQYKMQLVECSEPENAHMDPVWILANPTTSEHLFSKLLDKNFNERFTGWKSYKKQYKVPCTNMRTDFLVEMPSKKHLIEIKLVVDTDYDRNLPHDSQIQALYFSDKEAYKRSGLFPWGRSHQKGPNGEKVVSSRAIKHVMELTHLVETKQYDASIVFMVCRSDAYSFTPNAEACPSFRTYLCKAKEVGVNVIALKISFDANGEWEYHGELPVLL